MGDSNNSKSQAKKEIISRILNKLQYNIKLLKESENNYISSINSANELRENFIENMKKTMNQFQVLEEKLGEIVKDSLRKYGVYQLAYIRNMQYDVEKKANVKLFITLKILIEYFKRIIFIISESFFLKFLFLKIQIMENINIQHDIKEFMENNKTNDVPPYKFEFIPYISDIDDLSKKENLENDLNNNNNDSLNNSNISINSVKSFFNNVFFNSPINSKENNNSKINMIEAKDKQIFDEIKKIIDSSCINEDINSEIKKNVNNKLYNLIKINQFFKLSKTKKYRRFFLNNLDKLRLDSNFILKNKSFFNIGFLLNLSLGDSIKEEDYESITIIIKLGQSLYKNANEPNKPRVFLQSLLSSNYIWKEEKFWEELIKCK